MNHNMTTTTFELEGYQTTKNIGVVRGIVVRSRSIIGNIGAGIQAIFGGNITLFTNLCERAREEAFDMMMKHAEQLGANAVSRGALRRHRDHAGHHRGALLRNRGGGQGKVGRSNLSRPQR